MQKNDGKLHFFSKIFGHVKKKQYLCTRFRKESATYRIGAVVQLVRIHACHAWGRGFESRPHRKKQSKRIASFVVAIDSHPLAGSYLASRLERLLSKMFGNFRVPSAPQEAIREGCFFCCGLLVGLVFLVELAS